MIQVDKFYIVLLHLYLFGQYQKMLNTLWFKCYSKVFPYVTYFPRPALYAMCYKNLERPLKCYFNLYEMNFDFRKHKYVSYLFSIIRLVFANEIDVLMIYIYQIYFVMQFFLACIIFNLKFHLFILLLFEV